MSPIRSRLGNAYQTAGLVLSAAARSFRPKVPPYLIHFVTNRCNARCPFCFVTEKDEPELSLDEIATIAKNWRGVIQVTLTGGEPFLRDDLAEMVATWARAGARSITIATNGTLASRITKMVPKILAAHPRLLFDLDLSIDGPAEVHDQLRGEGSWDKAMAVARALAPLQDSHPGFRLGATLTISSFNQTTAKNTISELTAGGLFRRVQALLVRGKPREAAALDVDLAIYDQCRKVLDQARSGSGSGSGSGAGRIKELLSKMVRSHVARAAKENRLILPCRAGETLVTMNPAGRIYPCEVLDQIKPDSDPAEGIKDWSLGSLRESGYDVSRVMSSDEAIKIKNWIHDHGCYCTFECAAYNNLVFNYQSWPAIMARLIASR